MVDISAVSFCICRVYCSRREPTARVASTNSGIASSVTTVSCHDSTNIATSALANVMPFDRIEDSVDVTAFWALDTSDDSRDCRSPVRAPEKNESDSVWRWRYSRSRSSRSTSWPSALVLIVWTTPIRPEARATAIMIETSTQSNPRSRPSGPKSASSKTLWINSGFTTPRAAPATTSTPTTNTRPGYGANSFATRDHENASTGSMTSGARRRGCRRPSSIAVFSLIFAT